ncbi:RloB family protein [Streptomyces sp. NPDC004533]|uniref:RloB family protein n=1 Tax=Streptomyces sp. NPDC004533 TaxID=3154278 RepID=UPI0033BA5C07
MVVCGAKTTEYDYLKGFKSHFRRRNLSVQVTKKPGSPLQVVQYAVKRWGGAGGEFDGVWCVVDVDQFQDLDEALLCAAQNDVELVISNPCFEIWLLLHHIDHRKWVRDYNAVKPLLQQFVDVPSDKSVDFARDFGGDRWKVAVERARPLALEGSEHKTNPSTRMWRLALAINGGDV